MVPWSDAGVRLQRAHLMVVLKAYLGDKFRKGRRCSRLFFDGLYSFDC